MSRFELSTSSGPPPPGSTETLTGNSGGAVGPDGANNINVLGDPDSHLTVTGTPGSNLLTWSVTNQLIGTATTVEATQEVLWMYDLGNSPRTYLFSISVVGYEATTPALISFRSFVTAATNGVSAFSEDPLETVISYTNGFESAQLNRGFGPNNFNLSVLGVAGYTIEWKAEATFVRNT